MSEWKEYKLGEITNWFSGGTPSKEKKEYWGGSIPWISAKSMTHYKVSTSELNITEDGLLNGSRLAKERDILLLVRGSGLFNDVPINMVEKPVAFNQDIKAIRSKKPQLQDYIFYWLHANKKSLNDILEETGIGAGKFDTDLLKKLEISIPTNNLEFDFIVQTAKAIFDKIDLLHRQNATFEKMAETLFRHWFVEGAKEEWEDSCLEKHIIPLRGLSYKGNGLTEKGFGLPMHNLNSVYEGGGYKFDGIKYYSGEYKERHIVYPGDIIITNTEQGHEFRLIGFPAIVSKYFGEIGLFSQHIYRVQLKNTSYLSTEYLYYLLMSSDVREQIISATNGSTVNMLAIDGLQRPGFKLPPNNLVKKFTDVVSNFWQKKEINQNQIRTLIALRDTLLPKLMSGQVIVT